MELEGTAQDLPHSSGACSVAAVAPHPENMPLLSIILGWLH
jgi:hypothetical protein